MTRRLPAESKSEAFRRLAESRTNSVLDKVRILGNCANPYAYEWTDADIREIFAAIRHELERTELRFDLNRRTRTTFSLAADAARADPAGASRARRRSKSEQRMLPVRRTAAGLTVMPVGRGKSRVQVTHTDATGWRVVAKDKGHKKGYQLELFGPEGAPAEISNTAPGTLRAQAVELASELLLRIANATEPGRTDAARPVRASRQVGTS